MAVMCWSASQVGPALAHLTDLLASTVLSYDRRGLCARALASELGRPLAEFPGGHAGFKLHHRAFAARRHETLKILTG